MAIARISDIRGLVSMGEQGEEILKNRDLISEHGALLTIEEFAKIIFDDGREIEVTGPVTFKLDSSFFNEGTFENSITQISDYASLDYLSNQLDESNLNTNLNDNIIEQNTDLNLINSEQLDSQLNFNRTVLDDSQNNQIVNTLEETQNNPNLNVQEPANPENIEDDTSIIVPTISLDNNSDSGVINDNKTNDNTPTINGTGEPGSRFTLTLANGTVLASGIVNADGTFSVTTPILSDGINSLIITTTDSSGNSSNASLNLNIDTSADTNNDFAITVDTSDEVTNANEVTSVSTTLSGVDSDAVSVEVTFSSLNGGTSIVVNAIQNQDGTWSISDADLSSLNDGSVTVSAKVIDNAGNIKTVSDILDLDTSADDVSLSLATDTGSNNSDNVTSDTTVNVSGLENTSSWEYSTDGGQTWIVGSGTSFELAQNTSYANEAIQVKTTDEAGNETIEKMSAVRTDDVADDVSLSLATDTGSNNSDNVTSDTTVNVSGLENTSSWEYSTDGGQTWIVGSGTSFELAQNTSYANEAIQVKTNR